MLDITPIGDSFAAEVHGLQLWQPQAPEAIAALRSALSERGVLLFRRQALSEDELVAFSARFGEPERIVRDDWASRQCPELTYISNMSDHEGRPIGGLGTGELAWHTDQSYMPAPATGSFLYATELPKEGGQTCWASLYLAYEGLPEEMRQAVEGRKAVFSYAKRVSGYDGAQPSAAEIRQMAPDIAHSLVHAHPVTGRRALYLDPSTTAGVAGMDDADGAALLRRLAEHASEARFVYAHDWQIGDVVVWDNGCTLHRRNSYDATQNRLLKRTTVKLPPAQHIVPGAGQGI